MERVVQFVSAVLAGCLIGIGGIVFLSVENPILGAFFFCIGLMSILGFGLHLFTGKVGYLPRRNLAYLIELCIVWIGNFIGTFLVAKAVLLTRLLPDLGRAKTIVSIKLGDKPLSAFILAIFCGLLMYIAAEQYKKQEGAATLQAMAIILCVMVFILSGFEHSVANMFYFALTGVYSPETFFLLLIVTLGNSLGAMILATYQRFLLKQM